MAALAEMDCYNGGRMVPSNPSGCNLDFDTEFLP